MKSPRILRRVLALALSLAGTVWAQRTVTVEIDGNQITGTGTASIMLASQGDENALGFSVTFNPAVLRYEDFKAGADTAGATINLNAARAAEGRLGLAIAVAAGSSFRAGGRQLVVLRFTVLAEAASEAIGFGDSPIRREIAGVTAHELTATYHPAAIATRRSK